MNLYHIILKINKINLYKIMLKIDKLIKIYNLKLVHSILLKID